VQGPLARYAEDLELALNVIAGPGIGEDVGWQLRMPAARHQRLSGYRVAVLPAIPWLPMDDQIMAAVDDLATKLSRAGAKVEQTQPEILADMRDFYALYRKSAQSP
jgi:amidase